MMRLWSRVCFLVLVISTTSRGHNITTATPVSDDVKGTNSSTESDKLEASSYQNQSEASTAVPTLSETNTTDLTAHARRKDDNTTQEVSGSTVAAMTTSGREGADAKADDITTVPTATGGDSVEAASSSWAYVILVLIILVIIILCVILYLLRRASRTYTFDLQRPSPSHNDHTGTFEPVYLDDLDRPVAKNEIPSDDLSPPPVANGTSPPPEEKATNGETVAPQEQPDGSGVDASPVGSSSPTLAEESADKASSPSGSTSLFFDAVGEEQQNENNNNPCTFVGPFVEISLDEPALCDQLLTSPGASSSVLPFSSFSFSSS